MAPRYSPFHQIHELTKGLNSRLRSEVLNEARIAREYYGQIIADVPVNGSRDLEEQCIFVAAVRKLFAITSSTEKVLTELTSRCGIEKLTLAKGEQISGAELRELRTINRSLGEIINSVALLAATVEIESLENIVRYLINEHIQTSDGN